MKYLLDLIWASVSLSLFLKIFFFFTSPGFCPSLWRTQFEGIKSRFFINKCSVVSSVPAKLFFFENVTVSKCFSLSWTSLSWRCDIKSLDSGRGLGDPWAQGDPDNHHILLFKPWHIYQFLRLLSHFGLLQTHALCFQCGFKAKFVRKSTGSRPCPRLDRMWTLYKQWILQFMYLKLQWSNSGELLQLQGQKQKWTEYQTSIKSWFTFNLKNIFLNVCAEKIEVDFMSYLQCTVLFPVKAQRRPERIQTTWWSCWFES